MFLKPAYPRLNPAHPMTRYVSEAWMFNEKSGNTINCLGPHKNTGTITSSDSIDDQWAGSERGTVYQPTNNSTDCKALHHASQCPVSFAVECMFRMDVLASTNGRNHMLYTKAHSVAPWGGYTVFQNQFSPDAINIQITDDNEDIAFVYHTANLSLGWHHHIMNVQEDNDVYSWIDGGDEATGSMGSDTLLADGTLAFGSDGWGGAILDGALAYVIIWDHALTDDERLQRWTEPFRIFAPQRPWFLTSGAAPQDLTLPTISSGETLYAQTVAPVYDLTLPTIGSGETLYAQTVAPGAVDLTLPTISSGETLYAMAVALDQQYLTLPTISSGETLYSPTIALATPELLLPHIGSGETLYSPTVTTGPVSITLPTIATTVTMHSPTITLGDLVSSHGSLTLSFLVDLDADDYLEVMIDREAGGTGSVSIVEGSVFLMQKLR